MNLEDLEIKLSKLQNEKVQISNRLKFIDGEAEIISELIDAIKMANDKYQAGEFDMAKGIVRVEKVHTLTERVIKKRSIVFDPEFKAKYSALLKRGTILAGACQDEEIEFRVREEAGVANGERQRLVIWQYGVPLSLILQNVNLATLSDNKPTIFQK